LTSVPFFVSFETEIRANMKIAAMLMLAAGIAAGQTKDAHFDILRTLDGQSFTNATITRTTAAFAIVDFDGGGKRIAFTNLSEAIQKRFGFDPVKAQEELDLQARRKQEAKDRLDAQIKARQDADQDGLFRIVDDKVFPVSQFQNLHGQVSRVLSNGILVLLYERVEERHRYSGGVTANQSVGAYVGPGAGGGSYTTYSDELGDKIVFIRCPVRDIAERQDWKGLCLRNGTFANNGQVIEKYDTGVSSVTRSDAVMQEAPVHRPVRPATRNPFLRQ
jgi:hypothetical protein